MREADYSKRLDANFKAFVSQKKKGRTPRENQDSKADSLVIEDMAKVAREFG